MIKINEEYMKYMESIWLKKSYTMFFIKKMNILQTSQNINVNYLYFSICIAKLYRQHKRSTNLNKNINNIHLNFINYFRIYRVKGIYIYYYLYLKSLQSTFFEGVNVKVAGRIIKVPNAVLYTTPFRKATKLAIKYLNYYSFYNNIHLINSANELIHQSPDVIAENLVDDVWENRMFTNFRWKNRVLKSYTPLDYKL